jgi:serine/threonine-protein kinase HipA
MRFAPVRSLQVTLDFGTETVEVGRLAWVGRRLLMEFSAKFLARPLPLSPLKLPVQPGVHEERTRVFEGLHGVFSDSLPDGWGRLLTDRLLERHGVDRHRLTPLDRLALVGRDGFGALCYQPELSLTEPPEVIDLLALAQASRAVLEGDEATVFPELLALEGSSGGARPKVALSYHPQEGRLLAGRAAIPPGHLPILVKFGSRNDPVDIGAIEQTYAIMARAAGLAVSPCWLLAASERHPGFFATQRFDRQGTQGNQRLHLHSLSGLLHADHRYPSVDYRTLLRTTRWLTRDQQAVEAVFRLLCFNAVAHNRDDHSRNFSFLMDRSGAWRPSPAYDLTFSAGPGGEHWMTIGGEGMRPERGHILAEARAAGVSVKRAATILLEVREAVSRWSSLAEQHGVSRASVVRIDRALASRLADTR